MGTEEGHKLKKAESTFRKKSKPIICKSILETAQIRSLLQVLEAVKRDKPPASEISDEATLRELLASKANHFEEAPAQIVDYDRSLVAWPTQDGAVPPLGCLPEEMRAELTSVSNLLSEDGEVALHGGRATAPVYWDTLLKKNREI